MGTMQREEQVAAAEELLGDRLERAGFVNSLYYGQYAHQRLPAYPVHRQTPALRQMLPALRDFCRDRVDPVAIDQTARIPDEVIRGLGDLGVLGACLPRDCGGRGMSQTEYCEILEVLGGHCASTALFVNAHHSIGPRAIVLFGTPEQQTRYLPQLATGEWISAFALTEEQAGSDAANVQSTAEPTADGRAFVINGGKRWITNGGIAQVLTVIARTPVVDARGKTTYKPTAFLVTPDMPGFRVVEARMPKCGVRGTATARLAFENLTVPRENILGRLGKGLKVALTVLDFGRTTFGASCTGAAKFCLQRAVEHARSRVQFGQRLGEFELVKEKLARTAAGVFAMEAMTYQTAALIDADTSEFMLETAILKVVATETLWNIIHDTFQLYGGKAYFTDEPFERMLRDARINLIGEGANDVLRVFVAMVGLREVGLELQGVLQALKHPLRNWNRLTTFAGRRLESVFRAPEVPVRRPELQVAAAEYAARVASFGAQVEKSLAKHQEAIVDRQYVAGRFADAVMELYSGACVLRRLDAELALYDDQPAAARKFLQTGLYALILSGQRIDRALRELHHNADTDCTRLADEYLGLE